MSQFQEFLTRERQKNPGVVLLVQVGNFWQLHGPDSQLGVDLAGLKLQARRQVVGVPLDKVQSLLDKLIAANHEVNVYPQETKKSKTIQRRLSQKITQARPIFLAAVEDCETTASTNHLVSHVLQDGTLISTDVASGTYCVWRGLGSRALRATLESLRPVESWRSTNFRQLQGRALDPTLGLEDILQHIQERYQLQVPLQRIQPRRPLLRTTSDQLGLGKLPDIPDLIKAIAGVCGVAERSFLTHWLLVAPKERQSMERLLDKIEAQELSLSRLIPLHPRTTLAVFQNANGVCKDTKLYQKLYERLVGRVEDADLFRVTREFLGRTLSGQSAELQQAEHTEWLKRAEEILKQEQPLTERAWSQSLPDDFLDRHELRLVAVSAADQVLERERTALDQLIAGSPVKMDTAGRLVWLTAKPGAQKISNGTWLTPELDHQVSEYLRVCHLARQEQLHKAQQLARVLTKDAGQFQTFLWSAVIARAVWSHLGHTSRRGWGRAIITKPQTPLEIEGLVPYWMDDGEPMNVRLDKMWLLTAPNANGKTTFIRSLAVAALLAHAGLRIPATGARIPQLSSILLRLGGIDRPTEGLSSFEAEAKDLELLLHAADSNSLVCLDEMGRTTCPREAEALSRAVLEYLCGLGALGIFSTHLHPLVDAKTQAEPWTITDGFQLQQGCSRSSEALRICRRHHLPKAILQRAQAILTPTSASTLGKHPRSESD